MLIVNTGRASVLMMFVLLLKGGEVGMYYPEMRKDCPMRGNLGNCSPVGGFCMDAVSDEICEAVHNAYYHGFYNAVRTLKEQEAIEPVLDETTKRFYRCGACGEYVGYVDSDIGDPDEKDCFCRNCGRKVKWE